METVPFSAFSEGSLSTRNVSKSIITEKGSDVNITRAHIVLTHVHGIDQL